jgi:alkylation response protein AidB-like acyl-CoA dehydrogenase
MSGRKSLVLDAVDSDIVLAAARRDDGSLGVFLVDPHAPGLTRVVCRTADGRAAADLLFDHVALDRTASLGDGADAAPALRTVLDHALAALAAEAVGAMDECLRLTGAYLNTRKQFGAPLASFQALRHRVADMSIEAEQARSLALVAAMALDDAAPDAGRLAVMAKARAAQAGRAVGEGSIQLHGGIGMTEVYAAGAYYKRLIMTDLLFGNRDAQLRRLATGYARDTFDSAEALPC